MARWIGTEVARIHPAPGLRAGSPVLYVDERGGTWPALVTAIWREPGHEDDPRAAVNLVLVSPDARRVDPYGRAIERRTAVPHQSRTDAPAGCWRRVEEPAPTFAAVLTH